MHYLCSSQLQCLCWGVSLNFCFRPGICRHICDDIRGRSHTSVSCVVKGALPRSMWKERCLFWKLPVKNCVCVLQLYCIRGRPASQSGPHRREATSVRHMWARLVSRLNLNHHPFLCFTLRSHVLLHHWPVLPTLPQDLITWVISKSTRGLTPQTRRSRVTSVENPSTHTGNFWSTKLATQGKNLTAVPRVVSARTSLLKPNNKRIARFFLSKSHCHRWLQASVSLARGICSGTYDHTPERNPTFAVLVGRVSPAPLCWGGTALSTARGRQPTIPLQTAPTGRQTQRIQPHSANLSPTINLPQHPASSISPAWCPTGVWINRHRLLRHQHRQRRI